MESVEERYCRVLGRGLSEDVTSELRDKEPAVPTSVQRECPRAERVSGSAPHGRSGPSG